MDYLNSGSIRLRAVEPIDIDFILQVENDSSEWIGNGQLAPLSRNQIERYVLNNNADPFGDGELRLIAEEETGAPVGIVDLYEISPVNRTAMVAIYIKESERGKGIGISCLSIIETYARDILSLRKLGARIASFNDRSIRLFTKSGFRRAGLIPGWLICGGKETDVQIFYKPLDEDQSEAGDKNIF